MKSTYLENAINCCEYLLAACQSDLTYADFVSDLAEMKRLLSDEKAKVLAARAEKKRE